MPAVPPALTLNPFWMRPTGSPPASTPPRTQTTTLPVKAPAVGVLEQMASSPPAEVAVTTGVAVVMPGMIVASVMLREAPPGAVRTAVEVKARRSELAPTVSSHGPRWDTEDAPGPPLPAEVLATTPASNASRNARSSGEV